VGVEGAVAFVAGLINAGVGWVGGEENVAGAVDHQFVVEEIARCLDVAI
jgi:hypothetical protein